MKETQKFKILLWMLLSLSLPLGVQARGEGRSPGIDKVSSTGTVTAIVVSPAEAERIIGRTVQFTYALVPADAQPASVTWSSSDPSVAAINQNGIATALRPGTVTITARTDNGCEGTAQLTVPLPLYQLFVWMKSGVKTGYLSTDRPQFSPDGDVLHFQTDHISFDIPRDQLDRFTLEQVLPEHPTAITVSDELTMTTRRPSQLDYELTPADAQTTITWLNSAPDIVSVGADGTLTANAIGTATITAQTSNGLRDQCVVTVLPPHLKLYVWQRSGDILGYEFDEQPTVTLSTDAFVLTTTDTRIVYAPEDVGRFTIEDDTFIVPTLCDVNDDGDIDLTDAIMIVYHSLGQKQKGFNKNAADVNIDGAIDLTDAITVVYKSLGAQ